jgi:hypothetical protein
LWRQCFYIEHLDNKTNYRPVLWSPRSTCDNWFDYKGILIVNGNFEVLDKALWNYRHPAKVRFRFMPPVDARNFLMAGGFEYKGRENGWNGHASPSEMEALRDYIFQEKYGASFPDVSWSSRVTLNQGAQSSSIFA